VGTAPIAVGDGIVVNSGNTVTIVDGRQTTVLANDFNPNANAFGQQMTALIVANPAHASAFALTSAGTFSYTNNGDAATSDSFTYKACDSVTPTLCSAPATVTITVLSATAILPIVELPEAVDDAIVMISLGTASNLVGDDSNPNSVLDNDVDPNAGGHLTAQGGTIPSNGTLVLNSDGTLTYTNTSGTTDVFEYQACDSLYGGCALATVTITLVPGPILPTVLLPVAVDDEIQVMPNQTAVTLIGDSLNPSSVLDNDSDPNGGTLSAKLVGGVPQLGTLNYLRADGTFSYAAPVAVGSSSFVYEACDNKYGVCAAATVSVAITTSTTLNLVPVASPDTINVAKGGVANTLVGGATSVLANDIDPDGNNPLAAYLVGSEPLHGTLELNPDGTFTYTNSVSDPATSDGFEYEACDTLGACAATTVTINIGSSGSSNPSVACLLSTQVYLAANAPGADGTTNTISIDLSKLFTPPSPGITLSYSDTGLSPPLLLSLNQASGLLAGTLTSSTAAGTYDATLTATAPPPATIPASENVKVEVLSSADHIFRNGYDKPPQRCQ
jgi:hypothetical protein